jgi:hypothetical protein
VSAVCDHLVVKVVKQGLSRSAGWPEIPVQVIGLGSDFWFQKMEPNGDSLASAERLSLDPDSLLYYVLFREPGASIVQSLRVDTETFATADEAIAEAQRLATDRITWDN